MEKFIKVDDLKTQISRYIASGRRSLPISVIEEVQDKILKRAMSIEKVDNEEELSSAHVTQEQFEQIVEEVFRSFKFAQMDAGTAAGVVSAQSIGEPGTQMSLPGNEKVLVRQRGQISVVPIGELIDQLIILYMGDLVSESDVLEIPEFEIEVLGFGDDEKVDWYPVSHVSRHPPNGDLLEIRTRSGRRITSTFSHSFVLRRDNHVIPTKGSELRVGDRLPLVQNIPVIQPVNYLDVHAFVSEPHVDNEIIVTVDDQIYSSDRTSMKKLNIESMDLFVPSFSYSTAISNLSSKPFEKFELNAEFGYFTGIYLSNGYCTTSSVVISHPSSDTFAKIKIFTEKFGIKSVIRTEGNNSEIILHSHILSKIMRKLCGGNPETKFVNSVLYSACDEYLSSLLLGYIEERGKVDNSKIYMDIPSMDLAQSLGLILSRFHIYSERRELEKSWEIQIAGKYANSLIQFINLEYEVTEDDTALDLIPGIGNSILEISKKLSISPENMTSDKISRERLRSLISDFEDVASKQGTEIDLSLLKKGVDGEVFWDEIVSLKRIPSPTPFVYDFTVPNVETFTTVDGLVTHNTLRTFHFSGVREMNVTLGLPRLIEIIDARRKPSTPTMTIALDEDYIDMKVAENPEKTREDIANEIAQRIELTTIYSVAKSIDIDQVNLQITIVLDKILMEDKGITVEDIKKKIEYRRSGLKCLTDDDSDERIHVIYSDEKKSPTLQELQKLKDKLISISIKGLKEVPRVMIKKKTNEEGKIVYEITSEGSRFTELLRIPGVDPKKTYTNHIHEVAETLGIEAARNAIKREAQNVMEKQSLEVDERHMLLVADIMTQSGDIQQIGRHGISGRNASVLARAAFEVTVKHLLDAAAKGERDNLVGIIENVIVGQEISLGTGVVDLTISLDYRKYAQKGLTKKVA